MSIYIEDISDDILDRNYAYEIDEQDLDRLGNEIVTQVEIDLDSRSDWEEQNEMWMQLAVQILEEKNFPWPNASAVKYPLLATASLQFHARSYPALVNEQSLVKIRKFGKPSEEKNKRAERIRGHMSYQILEKMTEWQDDMDRLLYILPITGLVYKKVYWSPSLRRLTAPIILAKDVIINYEATNFERAIKTHRIYMDSNELREMQNLDVYRDVPLIRPEQRKLDSLEEEATGRKDPGTQSQEIHTLYEVHGWWDFDDDGYKEPYIVTVDKDSQRILRITARWDDKGIVYDDDGEILKIEPIEYFIPYKFLPNPESSIYALGFGSLLGPLNSATNTVINQLIDAGTLATTQGGFLSKQIRSRGGAIRFKPGEWKQLPISGDDLRKGIFPLPIKEPSTVLFQLLGLLIQSGEKLSSVQDLMVGENPGQNQPYATTMAVLEQGLKVFTGIYKRIYRSLGVEFKRVFKLNSEYLNDEEYYYLHDLTNEDSAEEQMIARLDYTQDDLDVIPGADPTITSQAHQILRAQSLEQKLAMGFRINPQVVLRMSLEAEGHTNIAELMDTPEPAPDPELVMKQQEAEHKRRYDLATLHMEAQQKRFEAFKDLAQAISHLAKAESAEAQTVMQQVLQQHKMLMEKSDSDANLLSIVGDLAMREKEAAQGQQEVPPKDTGETQ
jgi:chaperonin GroES